MSWLKRLIVLLVVMGIIPAPGAYAEVNLGGTIYIKWLDGNRHTEDGLQNNAENNDGDQGQGSEIELLFDGTLSEQVSFNARIQSRSNSHYWTNSGGWGGGYTLDGTSISSSGEYNPLEAQYVKLRGVTVKLTPGYDWIDSATIGSNNWGQFDPFVVGAIRYIDRDNLSGLLFQGSALNKTLRYDVARISLPKLWAGPGWTTGDLNAEDAAYAGQIRYSPMSTLNITGIGEYSRDQELDETDDNILNGQSVETRVRDVVLGLKGKYSPADWIDLSAAVYRSDYNTFANLTSNWSPYLNKSDKDYAWKINIDINQTPIENLSCSIELFSIGAEYQSIMAARREADVLLTEGHDASWGARSPLSNNEIGYGGWDDTAQQVATFNVDNDFTDFDERMAETCIGWKGITIVPRWQVDNLRLQAEITYLDYNTNWQAFDEDDPTCTDYPLLEASAGVGINGGYRSPYAPFQDKNTLIAVLNWNYDIDLGTGINLFGKFKWISEEDKRVDEEQYLSDGTTTPWYPSTLFRNLDDDDRDLKYYMTRIGSGYQLTQDLYGKLYYEYYRADLDDGTVAFTPPSSAGWWSAPYQSGDHFKHKFALQLDYFLSGMEFGLNTQWLQGKYKPKFRGDYTLVDNGSGVWGVQLADGTFAADETKKFAMYRLKGWMKVKF